MNTVPRFSGILLSLIALMLMCFACSDDEGPTDGGEVDNVPPKIAMVTALNSNNVQVEFDEMVSKESAERSDSYLITRSTSFGSSATSAAPGDTIQVGTAVLLTDGKTVLLSTWTSMDNISYVMTVKNVQDVKGNRMTTAAVKTFTGSTAPDDIDPEIISRSPAPNATNVGTAQSVIVKFSEPMNNSTVFGAFTWKFGSSTIPVTMEGEGNEFVFTPLLSLQLNTDYDVSISGAAEDWAGNSLTATTWSFRTTSVPDLKAPTFVSSSPNDGAVNVSTAASFRVTFSETIDPLSLRDDAILVTPNPGDGTGYWSNGGKTLNFEPDVPLADDTQYFIVIPEGALKDLAGNWLAESVMIQFTTGPGFASGMFSGVVEGDQLSDDAGDPEGAVIVAPTSSPLAGDDEGLEIFGADFVGAGGVYSLERLPDNWYFPFSIMDSNGDGRLEPDLGDALGAYGVDIRMMDTEYDSVQITGGGALTDINFKLFDPMAIAGRVAYLGDMLSQEELLTTLYSVGFFDTTDFDPSGGFNSPDFYVADRSVIFRSDWFVSELGSFPPPVAGTYWVAAYMEVDGIAGYDPDTEPAGVYMNTATREWIPVTIENGKDALGVDIYMIDPLGGVNLPAFGWPDTRDEKIPESVGRIRRLQEWMRRALDASQAKR